MSHWITFLSVADRDLYIVVSAVERAGFTVLAVSKRIMTAKTPLSVRQRVHVQVRTIDLTVCDMT